MSWELVSPSVCACGVPLKMLTIEVQATTGNVYNLKVATTDTIDYLRRIIAKKTKLAKDRIVLLFRDRQLRDGSLEDNSVIDGAKLHLVPSVETGLLSQRPEQSVMQALESLNDGQVTDFLSGKAPLNLTMRLGDHMMLIQLQLSTVSPVHSHHGHHRSSSSRAPSGPYFTPPPASQSSSTHMISQSSHTPHQSRQSRNAINNSTCKSSDYVMNKLNQTVMNKVANHIRATSSQNRQIDAVPVTDTQQMGSSNVPIRSSSSQTDSEVEKQLTKIQNNPLCLQNYSNTKNNGSTGHHQGSNSVRPQSSSVKHHHSKHSSKHRHHHHHHIHHHHHSPSNNNSNPVAHHYHPYYNQYHQYPYQQPLEGHSNANNLNKNSNQQQKPVTTTKNVFNNTASSVSPLYFNPSQSLSIPSSSQSARPRVTSALLPSSSCVGADLPPRTCSHVSQETDFDDDELISESSLSSLISSSRRHSLGGKMRGVGGVGLDTKALAEASRNLTQTLRQLSSEVLTNKTISSTNQQTPPTNSGASTSSNNSNKTNHSTTDSSNNRKTSSVPSSSSRSSKSLKKVAGDSSSTYHGDCYGAIPAPMAGGVGVSLCSGVKKHPPPQGAIIESMQHHGKGVFSGTFSGTLNPALQDRQGRPKRDISTIVHILNDLLCATPQITSTQTTAPQSNSSISPPPVSPSASKATDSDEPVSAENAATKSRVEQLRAQLQQRAERRKARRLAKTMSSTHPYSSTSTKSTNELNEGESDSITSTINQIKQLQHTLETSRKQLMREILCSAAGDNSTTGEALTVQTAALQQDTIGDFESEQHSIEQVENTFSLDHKQVEQEDMIRETSMTQSTEEVPMEVNSTIEASAAVENRQSTSHQQDIIKQNNGQGEQSAQKQEQQVVEQSQEKEQSQESSEQDTAKMVSLNSGAVVA